MIETVTIRFDTGEDYVIDFNTASGGWIVHLETKTESFYTFLDKAIAACYEDFVDSRKGQINLISANF